MALKKSQLYSSLWQSCDELRGGMDASQYKDYILTLLFMKFVLPQQRIEPKLETCLIRESQLSLIRGFISWGRRCIFCLERW